jgi:hypothetical protein
MNSIVLAPPPVECVDILRGNFPGLGVPVARHFRARCGHCDISMDPVLCGYGTVRRLTEDEISAAVTKSA